MRLSPLSLLLLTSISSAQTASYQPTDAQLLAGSKNLMERYLVAVSKNSGPQIAAFYHDSAVISVERQYSDGRRATIQLNGIQYKQMLNTAPLNEAPDRYTNLSYKVIGKGVVEVMTQRQSVSRGYTAPNAFYIQPDTTGRYWIVKERGIQRVK